MFQFYTDNAYFPQQRVGKSEKNKAEWYANCIDYIIAAGMSMNDRAETEVKMEIPRGNIPNEYYKKTLNPYNSAQERFTRFPATMRNLDIMSDIIRRYVSEYFKGVHEFTVSADSPDIVLKRNAKLQEEIAQLAMQAFQQEMQKNYEQMVQQAQQQGTPIEQIDPQQAMPDPEQFMKQFNEKYIDDESKQGQMVLNYIRNNTNDNLIYLSAYHNFCTIGECYTYTDIRGDKIVKESIPLLEAYPVPNENFFVEDHDMFARKMMLSYPQIIDMFDEYLDSKDREFLEKYYNQHGADIRTQLLYNQYFEYYPDCCEKFYNGERKLFRDHPVDIAAGNNGLFEVWHVVWRGEAKRGILTYQNEIGMESQRVVEEGYQMNPEQGDISIEWVYEPQIYEGYRIGHRYMALYPIKARPVAYQRNGKLPYNGIMEVLPFMGKFSIISLIAPYQILRNIISYHREMVIAKNKMLVLLLPESLIASETEDKIYKMAADGVLIVDDSEDVTAQKMANIRMLNASMGDYITQLTNLMQAIKEEAWEVVDMNMQRYGQINQSAGIGTTQEAIARSSMGSVVIVTSFDEMRCRDYQRDMDFAKLAYIDGLNVAYNDSDTNSKHYLSLDVNSYVNSDYSVYVKNNQKELDKLNQLKQWAFSAAQNGDLDMALAAITGDNVTQIKDLINQFSKIKRQHEEQMKQADQMLEQQKLQNEIAKIQAKGEEDRKTEALKLGYQAQFKAADIDMAAATFQPNDDSDKVRLQQQMEQTKRELENSRLQLDREKMNADLYSKAADRQIKREEMANDLKIARTNKNKYDK